MIPRLLPLTQAQLALLERLAGQGEAHPLKIVLTDDLPVELLIGSTVLVTPFAEPGRRRTSPATFTRRAASA